MGKGGNASSLPRYTAKEVLQHSDKVAKRDESSSWIVYRGEVYDVSNFVMKHPGGSQILLNYLGEDATSAMDAFHPNPTKVAKYLKTMHVGSCPELLPPSSLTGTPEKDLMYDFNILTQKLKDEGYFESNKLFFFLQYVHILAMEAFAWYLVQYHQIHTWGYGGWIGYSILALIMGLAQCQAGYLQHDAGHYSIFESERLNWFAQQMTMGFLVGASATWWKERHNRHHAKTNIFEKDPDLTGKGIVAFEDLYYLKSDNFFSPSITYNRFTFVWLAVPSTATWLFVDIMIKFLFTNGLYIDMFFMGLFYLRNFLLYFHHVGFIGGAVMYLGLRLVQSYIFTWVTVISHVPLPVTEETPNEDWVHMQLRGTQNIAGGYFNNWFTGHLNYQIEHHLWPLMPRSSYPYVQKYVHELCAKHDVEYLEVPSLFAGAVGVVNKLDKVGNKFIEWYKDQKKMKNKKV